MMLVSCFSYFSVEFCIIRCDLHQIGEGGGPAGFLMVVEMSPIRSLLDESDFWSPLG